MELNLLPVSLATSVISGISDIVTGGINAKRAKNVAEFNASMTGLESRMYRLSAKQEIDNIRKKSISLMSAQRAAIARSGLALEGSPIAVMTKSQEEAELDVIYANINMDYGASIYETQAGIQRMQGKQAESVFNINTAKTILNTGTDVYKQFQLSQLYKKE